MLNFVYFSKANFIKKELFCCRLRLATSCRLFKRLKMTKLRAKFNIFYKRA